MRHILCFGNPLHGDDGFGPAVFARLAQRALPAQWRAFEAGCRGIDALALLEDCDEVVIVDAAAPAGRPGRLFLPAVDEVAVESALPGHGAGVGYLLQAFQAMHGRLPPLRIVAVEMAAVTPFRAALSMAVADAVDAAVALIERWVAEAASGAQPAAAGRAQAVAR